MLKARLVKIGFAAADVDKMTLTEIREVLMKHAKKSTRKQVEARLKK